jgi:hypothetical protein
MFHAKRRRLLLASLISGDKKIFWSPEAEMMSKFLPRAISLLLFMLWAGDAWAEQYTFDFSVTSSGSLPAASITGALITVTGNQITDISGGIFAAGGVGSNISITNWVIPGPTNFAANGFPFFINSLNSLEFSTGGGTYSFDYTTGSGYNIVGTNIGGGSNFGDQSSVTLLPEIDGEALPRGLLLLVSLMLIGRKKWAGRVVS